MFVPLNKGTAAMLVSETNPPGIELYSYANVVLFWLKNMLIDHVSENTLYIAGFHSRDQLLCFSTETVEKVCT